MIKIIFRGIVIGTLLAIIISPITVLAETPQERWIRIQKESNKEFMDGCEKDGNLTQEAVDALSWGDKTKKPNKKTEKETKKKNNSSNSTYSNQNRGWVYSTDELHLVGLPEDERGYTRAGDYGAIE